MATENITPIRLTADGMIEHKVTIRLYPDISSPETTLHACLRVFEVIESLLREVPEPPAEVEQAHALAMLGRNALEPISCGI